MGSSGILARRLWSERSRLCFFLDSLILNADDEISGRLQEIRSGHESLVADSLEVYAQARWRPDIQDLYGRELYHK